MIIQDKKEETSNKIPSDYEIKKTIFFGLLLTNEKYNLTIRETQVIFEKYYSSINNNKIARKLNVSPQTVKTHIKNIYNKLGVNSLEECKDLLNEILGKSPKNYDKYLKSFLEKEKKISKEG
ncbi:regulatory protein, LuxR [Alkaliphilus metalliredigens QYMF]|uniref:Regulatory protein, LuxR n=1 Tax=Alkaliphilus metalliredigens (strain QYMF) TaxID=293826 RepID=A6TM38_ALKMQ|nr:LuxR C-terminal-related transcriptional regulator [Alkaliphilus metalliredigens]ABR47256.1 regulatory protein, LuxR [Alkaliphilus metalliredigens QYMF]